MDSSLLAAIQKGRGLKKSPRRPSTAKRVSTAAPSGAPKKPAASPGAPPPPAKPKPAAKAPGGPPAPPPPPPPPPPKGGIAKGKAKAKAKAPPKAPPKPAPKVQLRKTKASNKPAAPPPPKAPPKPKPKPAAPPPPPAPKLQTPPTPAAPKAPPPPAKTPPKPKPATPAPAPAPKKTTATAPTPPAPTPPVPSPTPTPKAPPPPAPAPAPAPVPTPAAPAPVEAKAESNSSSKTRSVSFAVTADTQKELSTDAIDEISEMVQDLRRLSPLHKGSKSPIAGLGLNIDTKYVPAAKENPKSTQKASPKVRHRRKSALKKSSTVGGPEQTMMDNSNPNPNGQQQQQGAAAGAGNGGDGNPKGNGSATSATREAAPSSARGGEGSVPTRGSENIQNQKKKRVHFGGESNDEEEASEYEFDYDIGEGQAKMMGSKNEKEAYQRHIPLEPLKDLAPLHKIIPLDQLLQEDDLEDQMVVSTREFNSTVQLFKDRERKYQEAIQILEEKNRTLSKIIVERDNVIAYLQAKLQSPGKPKQNHQRRGSYRELDLDSMDADEYPVLGMRNTSMPSIPGLTDYIERPSPNFTKSKMSDYSTTTSTRNTPSRQYDQGGDSVSRYLSSNANKSSSLSMVDQVYSSPFKSPSSFADRIGASSAGEADYDDYGGGPAVQGGLFSSRYAGELKPQTRSPSTPASSNKTFQRRLTAYDASSIFSKYT